MGSFWNSRGQRKTKVNLHVLPVFHGLPVHAEWQQAYTTLREILGLPEDDVSFVIPNYSDAHGSSPTPPTIQHSKRKADAEDAEDAGSPDATLNGKRSKSDSASATQKPPDQALVHAQAAASYIPFLSAESLVPPKLPTRVEMEQVLLGLKKQALVEEYFGTEPMVQG